MWIVLIFHSLNYSNFLLIFPQYYITYSIKSNATFLLINLIIIGSYFVCRCCQVSFRDRITYDYHKNNECVERKLYKCPHCPHKTKHFPSLKIHVYLHHRTSSWYLSFCFNITHSLLNNSKLDVQKLYLEIYCGTIEWTHI